MRLGGLRVLEMKLISWNVRGLGSFEKRKEVCSLVQEKVPLFCAYKKQSYKCVMMAFVLLCGVTRRFRIPSVLLMGHLGFVIGMGYLGSGGVVFC